MKIGLPTEIKTAEKRIALMPEHCAKLVQSGHEVYVQKGAGLGLFITDDVYANAGCSLVENAEELYKKSELIVKVKEPLDGDLMYLKSHHTLFCYLHLASNPTLINKLKEIGLKAYAFETVVKNGKTPLLSPMSAIAGRLSVQLGARFLHSAKGGKGVLLGGISTKRSGKVLVIGAGIAGYEAAALADGMGADVTVLDINPQSLKRIQQELPNVSTEISTEQGLESHLKETDLLIGAVYVVGRKAPHVVTKKQIKMMPKGSVVVDISIDQGGCIETSVPCTHLEPFYVAEGVIHSTITNLPAAAPNTASELLSDAIYPYVEQLAQNQLSQELEESINIQNGQMMITI